MLPILVADGTHGSSLSIHVWSHLRSTVSVFLQHNIAGAPLVISPSHMIIRTALIHRYGQAEGSPQVNAYRRAIADFFQSESNSIDPSRRLIEVSWALIQLKDFDSLSAFLRTESVMIHQWFHSGFKPKLSRFNPKLSQFNPDFIPQVIVGYGTS